MSARYALLAAVGFALAVAGTASGDDVKGLVGEYAFKRAVEGGETFTGTAKIEATTSRSVKIIWRLNKIGREGGFRDVGTGKLKNGRLTFTMHGGRFDGKGAYEVRPDGSLVGEYRYRMGSNGLDTLTPAAKKK